MIHITKYLYGKKRMSFANIFFAVFFLFAASFTFAQDADSSSVAEDWFIGRKIKDIIFEGLKHIKASELDGVTDSYVGKTLTYDLFYELNGKIYALDYFEPDIKPTAVPVANDVIIRFIVKERPTISKIDFVGNSGLRRNELLNVISIKPNEIANQVKIRLDEQELIKKYLEKGYPDISVTSTTRTDKNGSVNLTFTVSEGVKITIDAIYFEGNSVFSQKTLANQLSLKTKVLFKSAAFQEAKLIADRESIIKFYHDRGYIDAEITDIIRDITHDAAGNHLALTFRLSEGERYTFGGIIFDGNHIFNEKEMQALVQSKKNEIINQSRLDQDFMRIMNKYTQNGYIFNTIDPEEHRDNVNRTVSYTVNIVERGRAHLENIIVTGNKKTKDYVILRELPLETGDIFSNTKITSGYSNLYNMQFFSSVLMDPRQGSAEGLMDLIINVEEQPTTDLQAGLTFSGSTDPDAFPISLLFKWTDRNFFGRGNVAGAEINASPDVQSLSLQYTQKWMFGLPLSGGFDLTLSHSKRLAAMDNARPWFDGTEAYAFPDGFSTFKEYNDAGKLPPDDYLMTYTQWALSLGFSTGYRFWTVLGNLSVGGSIRTGIKYNDFENALYRPFDNALRNRNGEWTPANSLAFSVSLDKRDVYYDPTKGYYASERFGIYGILPKNIEIEHYNRSDTKLEVFFRLWRWQAFEKWAFQGVLGLHTGLSLIMRQPGYEEPIIEEANKLSIDGMFVGRGWSDERLNRGFSLWENWLELRIPIIERIISLDGFFDAAVRRPATADMFRSESVEGTEFIDDMRFSFGFGVRFALPQFPFRFLFAKRFRHYPDDAPRPGWQWMPGQIGGKTDKPSRGLDFVISFAISTY